MVEQKNLVAREQHGGRQETHRFSLVLRGINELTEEIENAVYEAGCDDCLLSVCAGGVRLDFDRCAESFIDAVLSAIDDVDSSDLGAQVARVEPGEFVTASEIARRLDRTRENVRQLISGDRGPGGFPAPFTHLTRRSALWLWTDVLQWFVRHEYVASPIYEHAVEIAALNSILTLRRFAHTSQEILTVVERVLNKRRDADEVIDRIRLSPRGIARPLLRRGISPWTPIPPAA